MTLRDVALRWLNKGVEERAIDSVPWDVGGPLRAASVSVDQALGLVPVFASVRLLSSQVASLPLQTYRKTGDSRQKIPPFPLFVRPSVQGTLYDWLHRCMTSLTLRGNAFGYITARDRDQYPTMIEWLHPDDVKVEDRMPSGPGSYTQPVWYWQGRVIPGEDLLHIPWFTVPGRILGLSPIGACAATISTGISAQHYTNDWFDAGAVPPGEFRNTGKRVTQEEADIISARLNAAIKRRKPLVYGNDWEYKPIAVAAHEAKFIETQRLTATQIASIYGIPPEMIGGEAGGPLTYNTVQSNAEGLEKFTLRPWLTLLEAAFFQLMPRPQYVKFNVDSLLRTDLQTRMASYQTGRQIGLYSIDEARAIEDLPPLPNGQGQDYTPLEILTKQAGPPAVQTRADPDPADLAAFVELLARRVDELDVRETRALDGSYVEPDDEDDDDRADDDEAADWDPNEPDPDDDDFVDDEADGRAVTPEGVKGGARLKAYWTKGPGLAKWVASPHPWTALYRHLRKYMPARKAKATAAAWFHAVKGYWPGHQKGKNPVGPRNLGANVFADLQLRRADPFDPAGLAFDERHLPGLHDQSKHGRPGVKGALKKAAKEIADAVDGTPATPRPARRPRRKAAVKKAKRLDPATFFDATESPAFRHQIGSVYKGEFAGFRTSVSRVEEYAEGVRITGEVTDRNGSPVGDFVREILPEEGVLIAYHSSLILNDSIQGQGFAEAFNAHMIDRYREMGLDRIELEANIDVGGYAWARAGFDFKHNDDADRILRRLREVPGADTPPVRDILDRADRIPFGEPGYPTAYEISQAGRPPGAGKADTWPGKAAMLGRGASWEAVKPL